MASKSDFIYRYRVRNWPDYNRALVRRGSLTLWVDEQAVRHCHVVRERPIEPSADLNKGTS